MGRLTELRDFVEGDRTADEAKTSYVHLTVDAEVRAARKEHRVRMRKKGRAPENEPDLFSSCDPT